MTERMQKAKKWVSFSGNRYKVAFDLGEYWAKYWAEERKAGRKCKRFDLEHHRHCSPSTEQSLARAQALVARKFPALKKEIECMVAGINCAGVKANYAGLFAQVLGEAGPGCATIGVLSKSGKGGMLSHNEEDSWDTPLCFSHVTISGPGAPRRFLSVSYPYQLFGSAAGATTRFAFSGNSIYLCSKLETAVRNTRAHRVPKTVLTRLLLEERSMAGAKQLLSEHHLLQANNLCFLTAAGPFKAQIVPNESLHSRKNLQIVWEPPVDGRICQTNHLRRDGQPVSGTECPPGDWKRRDKLEGIAASDIDSVPKIEQKMYKDFSKRTETMATITFEISGGRMSCHVMHYFTGGKVRLDSAYLE